MWLSLRVSLSDDCRDHLQGLRLSFEQAIRQYAVARAGRVGASRCLIAEYVGAASL